MILFTRAATSRARLRSLSASETDSTCDWRAISKAAAEPIMPEPMTKSFKCAPRFQHFTLHLLARRLPVSQQPKNSDSIEQDRCASIAESPPKHSLTALTTRGKGLLAFRPFSSTVIRSYKHHHWQATTNEEQPEREDPVSRVFFPSDGLSDADGPRLRSIKQPSSQAGRCFRPRLRVGARSREPFPARVANWRCRKRYGPAQRSHPPHSEPRSAGRVFFDRAGPRLRDHTRSWTPGPLQFPGRAGHVSRSPCHAQIFRNNPGRDWQERLGGG